MQPAFVFAALPILCLSRILSAPSADPDLFARVAAGRLVEREGQMPLSDPFAFTEKLPQWVDHEWLSGVVFWWTASHWGDAGLILLKAFLLTATIVLTLLAARLHAPHSFPQTPFLAACLLDGLFAWASTIRCQTFTYLFIAFQYYALLSLQKHHRWRYVAYLPVISVAWVNLHGGYTLGMLTLWLWTGISVVRRQNTKTLLLVSLLCSSAVFFTPYGASAYVEKMFSALTMERPSITEWAPLWTTPQSLIASSILVIPVIIGVARTRDLMKQILPLALLLFSLYLGVRHIRFGVFTSINLAIFGAAFFQTFWRQARTIASHRVRTLERAAATVGLAVVLASAYVVTRDLFSASTYVLNYNQYPVQAIEWLRREKIGGRLLVDFNNGSYALWRLYPRFTVSMDGRYEETYPTKTVQLNARAFEFTTAQGIAALRELNPTHILLPLTNPVSTLPPELAQEWHYAYRDARYAILTRDVPTSSVRVEAVPIPKDVWKPLF